MITLRGWGIVAAAIGGLLVAVFTLNLMLIAIAVFATVFVTVELLQFAVRARSFQARTLLAERIEVTTRLLAGGLGATRLRLENPGGAPGFVEIVDSTPEVFEIVAGSPRLSTWWPAGETLTVGYGFRARARGLYAVGPTELLVHDALGFAFRRITLSTRAEVMVSPAASEVTLRRSGFHLFTAFHGITPVNRRGYGTEFRALRAYQPGDDYRWIAWRRTQGRRLFVREFEQESRQDFLAVISRASPMGAGGIGETALDRACEATMLLVRQVPRGGDRIGLWLVDGPDPVRVDPGRGPLHTLRLTRELSLVSTQDAKSDVPMLLRRLTRELSQPTHVFLFAPVPASIPSGMPGLGTFRRAGHRLYFFPPDASAMYHRFTEPSTQVLLERAQAVERRRTWIGRTTLERLGIPVYPYGLPGAGSRLLSLYEQIRIWGMAR